MNFQPTMYSLMAFLLLAFLIGFVTAWIMRNLSWAERLRGSAERLHACERDLNAATARLRASDGLVEHAQRSAAEEAARVELTQSEIKRYADDLKRYDEDLASANEKKSTLKHQVEDLGLLLKARETEIDRLKSEQGSQQARLLKLESDVNQRGSQLSELRAVQDQNETALAQAQSELSECRGALSLRETELAASTRELGLALENHKRDLKGWEIQFGEMAAMIRRGPQKIAVAPRAPQSISNEKPARVYQDRPAQVDDLIAIYGVGPKLAALLNKLGVWQFRQVASWDSEDIAWFDERLEQFRGRIVREHWVASAAKCQSDKYGKSP